jgi:hypothetical protein
MRPDSPCVSPAAGGPVKLSPAFSPVKGSQMARTVREQQDKRREEKLKQVQEQVDEGSLVIRKMTQKERKDNPPKPRKEKKKKR